MNVSLRDGDAAGTDRTEGGPASTDGLAQELDPILDRHRQWVASGWEAGKRADLHGRDLHADLRSALLPPPTCIAPTCMARC